ncbi:MAG: hypothetical protein ACYTGF_07015 [Planctomycetota bacterium]|jgi:hypothetical protein
MQRWTKRTILLAVTLMAAGCARSGIFQQPLATDQQVRTQSTDPSLVLGGVGQENDWTARRNDGADRTERQLYYGPNGRLYYDDGSAVQFDSVKKQLQDLRAEERISPR